MDLLLPRYFLFVILSFYVNSEPTLLNVHLSQKQQLSTESAWQLIENLFPSSINNKLRNDQLIIELGLFIDDALWIHFQRLYDNETDSNLRNYAFAIVNNINALFRHPSLNQSIQLVVNYYAVMKVPPVEMSRNLHANGDARLLLDLFCRYQARINRNDKSTKRWDHALLFTGYDLYRKKDRTLAGYAPINGMCSVKNSCTISEGLDFSAAFIVAHEMGHNMGMNHDGENGCSGSCCIMSSTLGTGRTLWSSCSARELNRFIAKLDKNGTIENCLRKTDVRHKRVPKILAGQIYTLDQQCMIYHGKCWKHEIMHNEHINDVCKMIWCSNDEGIIRSAHPALEYSYCGHQMWCIEGRCIPVAPGGTVIRHGDWSDWKNGDHDSCTTKCIPCQIKGQIRVRRSARFCNNPYPNNGGLYCNGDDTRGIRCQKNKCDGLSIEQFATKRCTELRNSGDPSTKDLTGKGIQYDDDLCKIGCLLPYRQVRKTVNFPDGTPCGTEHYCIKGRCRKLSCDGRAIVELSAHCPRRYMIERNDHMQLIKKHTKIAMNDDATNQKIRQLWTEWSKWSSCTASICGQKGFRLRSACINESTCHMSRTQRESCSGKCTADDLQWTEWSTCSTSCGFGVERRRIRICPTCTIESNYSSARICFLKKCEDIPGRDHLGNQLNHVTAL